MAGRKVLAITDRQFEVLRVFWEHGPMTVREVMARLPRGGDAPYTTVLGLLQNMEKAGLLTHDAEGAAYHYRPTVTRSEATGSLLADFLARFFHGSAEQLVLGLVDAEQLAPDDLRAIEARLAEADESRPADGSGSQPKGRRGPKRKGRTP